LRDDFFRLPARGHTLFEMRDALLCADGPVTSPVDEARPEFRFAKPDTWGEPDAATVQFTDRHGPARAMAWDRIHPRLTTRSAWIDHTSQLPVLEGTLIRLQVDRLPDGHDPRPVAVDGGHQSVGRGRRSALAGVPAQIRPGTHSRMAKQTLDWTRPRLRTPAAADRWIWLVIAAHTQLRLPRPLAEGLRRPWEKPADPNPARAGPSRVQEPPHQLALPGPCTETQPARPRQAAGSKNQRPAIRYDVGKTTRRPGTVAERDQVRP
jgi:hypothetical protein